MFEHIFFAIVYGIMGLHHDKKHGCLTAILVILILIIVIGKIAY